ncbi:hypothetical protein CSUI_006885, partial [Cystoisospora suis]
MLLVLRSRWRKTGSHKDALVLGGLLGRCFPPGCGTAPRSYASYTVLNDFTATACRAFCGSPTLGTPDRPHLSSDPTETATASDK